MNRGYVRVGRGAPKGPQVAALVARGVADPDFDISADMELLPRQRAAPLAGRAEMLRTLRAGDVVWIATADRLGRDRADTMAVLAEVAAKGAAVGDAETGALIAGAEGLGEAMAFLDRAEAGKRKRSAAHARDVRMAKGGSLGGRPTIIPERKKPDVRAIWADRTLTARQAQARVVALIRKPISVETLYRRFPGVRAGLPAKPKPGGR